MSKRKSNTSQPLFGFSKKHSVHIKQFVSLILLLTSVPLAMLLTYMPVRLWSKAAIATSHIYFNPATGSMPPNGQLKVMLDSKGEPIGFAKVVINFDQTKVQLAQEIQTSAALRMSNSGANPAPAAPSCQGTDPCIVKTPMSEANNTGRIVLILGVKPGDPAPAGVFELATIPLRPVTTSSNQTATIQIDNASSQIVNMTPEKQNITSTAASYSLNASTVSTSPALIVASGDTYMEETYPSNTHGTSTQIEVDASPSKVGLVKFSLASMTQTASKVLFRIKVGGTTGDNSPGTFTVKEVASGWSESTVNYSTRPTTLRTLQSFTGADLNQTIEVDVTAAVNEARTRGAVAFSISTTSTDGGDFLSKETTNKPTLVITY